MNAYFTSSNLAPLASGLSEPLDRLAQQILYRIAYPKGRVAGKNKSVTPKGRDAGGRGMEKSAVSPHDLQDAWQIICAHLNSGTHERRGVGEIFASVRRSLHANNGRKIQELTAAQEAARMSDISFALWKGAEQGEIQKETKKELLRLTREIFAKDKNRLRRARFKMAVRTIFGVWQTKQGTKISKDFIKDYYK